MIIKRTLIYLLFASVVGCLLLFLNSNSYSNAFVLVVPKLTQLDFLESQHHYLWLMLFTIIPVALLSFDKKVHFYSHWPTLFPSIVLVGIWFIVWDVVFTKLGIWGFNPSYHLPHDIFGLPIEEWLFFFAIPFACYFIHVCLIAYFPGDPFAKWDRMISLGLGIVLILVGLWNWDKRYTAVTFILTGAFVMAHFRTFDNLYRTLFYRTFVVVMIPFLAIDGALTGWFTKEPIVLYSPIDYLGFRLGSVPIEDACYGFLLLMLITTLKRGFEQFRAQKRPTAMQGIE